MENRLKPTEAATAWKAMSELLKSRETIKVKIFYINKGGAITFVKGLRAFIPASLLSMEYVEKERMKQYVGKTMMVRVFSVDEDRKRLILSRRHVLKDIADKEREKNIEAIPIGAIRTGVVEFDYGCGVFVSLGKNTPGFMHYSLFPKKNQSPVPGQTVKVKVISKQCGRLVLKGIG